MAESIAPMRQAVRFDPDNADARHDLGLTLLECGHVAEAAEQLQRAIALKPGFAHAHYRLGIALERMDDQERAIAAYSQAVALSRSLSDAHARLAGLLQVRGHRRAASESYRRAAAGAPHTPAGRMHLARALIIEGRDAEAETALRRAMALGGANGEALSLLGTLLSEAGKFDDALETYTQAVTLDPRQARAWYDLVRCRRLTEADRPLIARMQAALPLVALGDNRAQLHLALGKAHDDLRDYELAMHHWVEASRLKPDRYGFTRAAVTRRVDASIKRFDSGFFARHAALGDASRLPILIVGLPRSGTTLVEQIVSSHPKVEGAGELHFWDNHGRAFERLGSLEPTAEGIAGIASASKGFLRGIAPSAEHVTDKMPWNFLWLGLFHLVFPNAVIIHCRRHPVDTCVSILSTYLAPRPDFSSLPGDLVFYHAEYERLMAHWRSVIPADRLLDVDYENLIANPEPITRQMIAFRGLEWDAACLTPERNTRVVRTASKWQARQPVYASSVERWRRYEPWLGPLRDLLAVGEAG